MKEIKDQIEDKITSKIVIGDNEWVLKRYNEMIDKESLINIDEARVIGQTRNGVISALYEDYKN